MSAGLRFSILVRDPLPGNLFAKLSSLSKADRGKRMKESKNIQQPQNYGNDHDAIQD
jgi:hypothetical protein